MKKENHCEQIAGCKTYGDNGCAECNEDEGFYLKDFNGVNRCIEFHYCKNVSTTNNNIHYCDECANGFESVDGHCNIYPECKTRESGVCEACNNGYLLKDGYCIQDFSCKEANADGSCKTCLNGREKNENGECIQCDGTDDCYDSPLKTDAAFGNAIVMLVFFIIVLFI